jgi:diguanylate cyclase (GGDEF)-like protein
VLRQLANLLQSRFRESDVLARFGGEEFCLLMTNLKREQEAFAVMDSLRQQVQENEFNLPDNKAGITVSVGVCTNMMDSLDEMIDTADEMLYKSKQGGRNLVTLYH